jgi:hypothetical protein
MKINLPCIKQLTATDCGPTALKSVLSYFGKEVDVAEMYSLANVASESAFWTVDLGVVAKKLGFPCVLYTTYDLELPNANLDLYRGALSTNNLEIEQKKFLAKSVGLDIVKKSLSLDEVLSQISEDSLVISLIDWNVIEPKDGRSYAGHFIALDGYEDNKVLFFDPYDGLKNVFNREIYDKARKARGTDEDLLVVRRR